MIKNDFVKFGGKYFTGDDLAIFIRVIDENCQSGRCEISRVICRQFNRRQPNGNFKGR